MLVTQKELRCKLVGSKCWFECADKEYFGSRLHKCVTCQNTMHNALFVELRNQRNVENYSSQNKTPKIEGSFFFDRFHNMEKKMVESYFSCFSNFSLAIVLMCFFIANFAQKITVSILIGVKNYIHLLA